MANPEVKQQSPAEVRPPEVRQNVDEKSEAFGSTAVRQGDNRWGIMNPGIVNPDALGGHWATDAEVEGWKALQ